MTLTSSFTVSPFPVNASSQKSKIKIYGQFRQQARASLSLPFQFDPVRSREATSAIQPERSPAIVCSVQNVRAFTLLSYPCRGRPQGRFPIGHSFGARFRKRLRSGFGTCPNHRISLKYKFDPKLPAYALVAVSIRPPPGETSPRLAISGARFFR